LGEWSKDSRRGAARSGGHEGPVAVVPEALDRIAASGPDIGVAASLVAYAAGEALPGLDALRRDRVGGDSENAAVAPDRPPASLPGLAGITLLQDHTLVQGA
jgi:hypothetical protein